MSISHRLHPRIGTTALWVAGAIFAVALAGGIYFKVSASLMPGPVSSLHPKNEVLGGHVSHAEFEYECKHCHAPLHCITDTKCQNCHVEIALEREDTDALHGRLPGTERCQTCHVEHMGRDAVITQFGYVNVDHYALAGFSLERHRVDFENNPLHCDTCHTQDRYVSETLDCLTCHADFAYEDISEHLVQFGSDCVPCHDGVDRMANFDHNNFYGLEGVHIDTKCEDCHQSQVFAGTAQDCLACHPDPESHAGKFGLECDRCHTAVAWNPAQLTRHTFFIDHGGNQPEDCTVCHIDSYTLYTCYQCHDHQPQQMTEVHNAEGIYEFENCKECHPTGQEGEAAGLTAPQQPESHGSEQSSLGMPYEMSIGDAVQTRNDQGSSLNSALAKNQPFGSLSMNIVSTTSNPIEDSKLALLRQGINNQGINLSAMLNNTQEVTR